MTNYADHSHLLHDPISAFRKGYSTTTALMRVRDDIRYAMKRKDVTLMVLADFLKAFDTISFSTTIVKFYKLGFSKPFLKWLLSYLSGRSQFVQIDNRKSWYQLSQYGIPQGSILGPMIFNLSVIFINYYICNLLFYIIFLTYIIRSTRGHSTSMWMTPHCTGILMSRS